MDLDEILCLELDETKNRIYTVYMCTGTAVYTLTTITNVKKKYKKNHLAIETHFLWKDDALSSSSFWSWSKSKNN